MKEINVEVDGKTYHIETKDGKTALVVKGRTAPAKENKIQNVVIPKILIITRKNADVLFILRGGKNDTYSVMTAQQLYDKFQYQWFEPLADNYRELLYVNNANYISDAWKVFAWSDIARFSLIDRPSYSFYNNLDGDWKQSPDGGAGYLLTLIENIPYWTDAVGQIPFAVDTFRDTHSITNTVKIGIDWGSGTITGESDYSNEYDNFFVLRGALYANKKFAYVTKATGGTYPSVVTTEISNDVDPATLGVSINEDDFKKYGIWKT
ncbi:hypothetical protein QMG90_06695 [Trabulsiella odontotermitis]|uniref:hypothetical protein n=1 Tax=Trabulsiella odontotermitis TaxID=379893 RepID=UPI0024B711F1|nr:hypothetical protein [Trabulsiella odontotermitis]WHP32597.1 hypothetical protein QMG90_06695 [Trabulsiella odontotermitis]